VRTLLVVGLSGKKKIFFFKVWIELEVAAAVDSMREREREREREGQRERDEREGVSVVYCKRKRNILWNVRVFRGIIEALKQQPRPI